MDERPTKIVPVAVLRDLLQRLLAAAGCGPEAAAMAADVFVTADLRGTGVQGLDHLPSMIRGLRNGKIETFNCYVGYSVMFAQMGVTPDFASAVDEVGVQ